MSPSPSDPSLPDYVGRYAPSPTGPLHLGSLVAAVGSYVDARAAGGHWLLRIDDLDQPRMQAGAADLILHTLEAFGFEWDGAVLYQSTRVDAYAAALDVLAARGRVFPCSCTRQEVTDAGIRGIEGSVYPGTCRTGLPGGREPRAWRMRVDAMPVCFEDKAQGRYCQNLAEDIGDFIIRRADGLFAYQLATVVDDAWQGVNHVVRGADLLISTPRQICLQSALSLPTPEYLHLPVALDQDGNKLSKQTGAPALDEQHAASVLWDALVFLHQVPPDELKTAEPRQLLDWAIAHWDTGALIQADSAAIIETDWSGGFGQ